MNKQISFKRSWYISALLILFSIFLLSLGMPNESLADSYEDALKAQYDKVWVNVKPTIPQKVSKLIELQFNVPLLSYEVSNMGSVIEGLRKSTSQSEREMVISIINAYEKEVIIATIIEMTRDSLTCKNDVDLSDFLLAAQVIEQEFKDMDNSFTKSGFRNHKGVGIMYSSLINKLKPYFLETYRNHPNRKTCSRR